MALREEASRDEALQLDLVEWVGREPRRYADVIDNWRTSCPRLTIWEDCVDRGFVTRAVIAGQGVMVMTTPAGRAFLRRHGRWPDINQAVSAPIVESTSAMATSLQAVATTGSS